MVCRRCGTEIVDNALICYRCGTAVEELPGVPPARATRRRRVGLLGPALALIVLVLAALFLGRASVQELPRAISWTMLALAFVVVAWWVRARRRR
jgi:hypothetical protein